VPRAASHIVSVVRRLLDDEPAAHVLLMPVLPGGDYSQPLPQRLEYPNRCAPALLSGLPIMTACAMGCVESLPRWVLPGRRSKQPRL